MCLNAVYSIHVGFCLHLHMCGVVSTERIRYEGSEYSIYAAIICEWLLIIIIWVKYALRIMFDLW